MLPLTAAAEAWLRPQLAPDTTWVGNAAVIELRFFNDLADAIIDAGFTFERDALPN